jgi:Flp pilus assembly protein TadG
MKARPKARGVFRSQEGAAAVEFALIVGVLLLLVFGIIEFGRVFSELGVLRSAAREGARTAAVRGSEDDVRDAIQAADDPFEAELGSFSMSTVCDAETQGEQVTVSWEQPIEIDIVLLPDFNQDIEIEGVFRCE